MADGPGGFFAVERHAEGSPGRGWLRLADLADDPAPLLDRIAGVRQRLIRFSGTAIDHRVAASTVHLGLVARLAAAGFAQAVSVDGAPGERARDEREQEAEGQEAEGQQSPGGPLQPEPWRLDPGGCWWRPGTGDPVPLSVSGRENSPGRSGDPLGWLESASLVTDVVRRHTGVSARVLRGNVASGANTAAVLLARHDPSLIEAIARQLAAVTGDPRLRGEPGPYGPAFRRRSCCLAYRAGLGYCGDCVLRDLTHPRRQASTG